MSIFSALNGNIYHFNSINTPIDNELAYRIKGLDDSVGKITLSASFDIALKTVLQIFHPNDGIFKNYINKLNKDSLREIWYLIIIYVIWQIIEIRDDDKDDIIKKSTLVLGVDEHRLNLYFMFFKDKEQNEQIFRLWHFICNQINPNLDNEENLFEFHKLFTDNYNKIFF